MRIATLPLPAQGPSIFVLVLLCRAIPSVLDALLSYTPLHPHVPPTCTGQNGVEMVPVMLRGGKVAVPARGSHPRAPRY